MSEKEVCDCGHPRGSHIRPFGCRRCACPAFTATVIRPRPDQLWEAARQKFPADPAARRIEYVRLMREHGHLRPTVDPRPRTPREFFGCDEEPSP